MGMVLRNGRVLVKKKNEGSVLREMVKGVKIVKEGWRKEEGEDVEWSGRGLKVVFDGRKIVFLSNWGKF